MPGHTQIGNEMWNIFWEICSHLNHNVAVLGTCFAQVTNDSGINVKKMQNLGWKSGEVDKKNYVTHAGGISILTDLAKVER